MRSHTVTRNSRYGLRGVRVGEASNPGPPRTLARVRMEQEAEAEATLSCLEAALTRIDDSDDEPLATWRDEVSESEEMGRRGDVRNVWARVGDLETHASVAPTLLDSLAEDLSRVDHDNERELIAGDAVSSLGVQSRPCVEREDDECSSVHSEFCWGEMEDIGDDEVPEWGVLPCPTSLAHAIPGPHGVDCDRVANHAESQNGSKKKRLLLIRNSQHETVAASSPSHNPFVALDDDQVDIVPRQRQGLVRMSQAHTISAAEFDLTHADSDVDSVRRPVGSSDSVRTEFMRPSPGRGHDVPPIVDEPLPLDVAVDNDVNDTESVDTSVQGASEDTETLAEAEVDVIPPRAPQLRGAFEAMDQVNVVGIFRYRVAIMKTVPRFLHGLFKNVMKVVVEEVMASEDSI